MSRPAYRKIVFYWLPVFLWMGIIFLASSIPSQGMPKLTDYWLFWAHRFGHMVEYSILGILWLRAYNYSHQPARHDLKPVLLLSVGILLFGLADEWHQSFVPGRMQQLLDSVFDMICGTIGMLVYRFRIHS